MQKIIEFVLSPFTENLIVPLIILALSIAAKSASKPTFSITRDDLFVCFDMLVSAIFLFIINMISIVAKLIETSQAISNLLSLGIQLSPEEQTNIQELIEKQQDILLEKIALSWGFLFILFLIIIILIFTTQKWGWNPSGQLNSIYGIAIPNIIALIFLAITISWITL